MTAAQFQAMCTAGGVTGKGKRELKKHLSAHLEKGFCPTRRSVNMLAEGHSEITYGCKEFKYNGKEIAEFIVWTEKTYTMRSLCTYKDISPANQSCRPISNEFKWSWVATTVTPPFSSARLFLFISETTQNQSICRKDTAKLIEATILERLTAGHKIVSMWHLQIEQNKKGQMLCAFKESQAQNSHRVVLFVTGNLAFQAMALGKELMAGWWCMLGKTPRAIFLMRRVRCGQCVASLKLERLQRQARVSQSLG